MNKKSPVLFFLLLVLGNGLQAERSLELIWETEPALNFPEQVVMEPGRRFLFVSILDGHPFENDGKGAIGKLSLDGKILDAEWVTGLDAPKGIGLYKNLLYVAELTELRVIDIDQAAVVQRIPIEGSRLLHNIAIDAEGVVYVSDLFAGKIFRVKNGQVNLYLEGLRGPAGIVLDGRDMYVFTSDGLLKVDANRSLTTVATGMDPRANGLVRVGEGEFVATCWGGVVYCIRGDGSHEVLFDTRSEGIPAGINTYDPATGIMYMTTDQHNTVRAYRIR